MDNLNMQKKCKKMQNMQKYAEGQKPICCTWNM